MNATSGPWFIGALIISSYMVTNSSGVALGLKLGASRPARWGVVRMHCNSGCDWVGLLRINSYKKVVMHSNFPSKKKMLNRFFKNVKNVKKRFCVGRVLRGYLRS